MIRPQKTPVSEAAAEVAMRRIPKKRRRPGIRKAGFLKALSDLSNGKAALLSFCSPRLSRRGQPDRRKVLIFTPSRVSKRSANGNGRNVTVRSRIGKISSPDVSMKGRQSERVFPLLVGRGNHYGSPSKESEAPVFGRRGFRDHQGRHESHELVKDEERKVRGAEKRKRSQDFNLIDTFDGAKPRFSNRGKSAAQY
jgi:hypothetical protein